MYHALILNVQTQVLDLSCVDAYSANYILGRTLKNITAANGNDTDDDNIVAIDKSSAIRSDATDTAEQVNDKYGTIIDTYQGTYLYTARIYRDTSDLRCCTQYCVL
jgi:hypothetical protein